MNEEDGRPSIGLGDRAWEMTMNKNERKRTSRRMGRRAVLLLSFCLVGICSGVASANEKVLSETESEFRTELLPDGIYSADFDTDSSMFSLNEASEGKGLLTVKDGEMSIHISLKSKKILNLFPGLAQEAEKEGASLLEPTTDTVTYSDGYTEEVFGFDLPVPALNTEFDLALIGTRGKWYDHKVSVKNPEFLEALSETEGETEPESEKDRNENGREAMETFLAEVILEGGSGRAFVESPCRVTLLSGKMTAEIVWSSNHYDYMLIDGEKILPENETDSDGNLVGNARFLLPIPALDEPLSVIADTTAMSVPHEIAYTLTFHRK